MRSPRSRSYSSSPRPAALPLPLVKCIMRLTGALRPLVELNIFAATSPLNMLVSATDTAVEVVVAAAVGAEAEEMEEAADLSPA